MSDFLTHLATRAVATVSDMRPKLSARFESTFVEDAPEAALYEDNREIAPTNLTEETSRIEHSPRYENSYGQNKFDHSLNADSTQTDPQHPEKPHSAPDNPKAWNNVRPHWSEPEVNTPSSTMPLRESDKPAHVLQAPDPSPRDTHVTAPPHLVQETFHEKEPLDSNPFRIGIAQKETVRQMSSRAPSLDVEPAPTARQPISEIPKHVTETRVHTSVLNEQKSVIELHNETIVERVREVLPRVVTEPVFVPKMNRVALDSDQPDPIPNHSETVVNVTIGRVEVRANIEKGRTVTEKATPSSATQDLREFLNRRST